MRAALIPRGLPAGRRGRGDAQKIAPDKGRAQVWQPKGSAEKTPRRRAAADAQGERRPPAAEVAELQRAGPWRRAEVVYIIYLD